MHTLTIKDIARELGISISTVSRALQNHPDISEETKRTVVAFAREHHYRPNQLATSLRTQRNLSLGVLLPEMTDYFFTTILTGAERTANKAGYNILVARTQEDPERERQCLQMLSASRAAGIIACPTKRTEDFSAYQETIEQGVPLVIVDRQSPVGCDQIVSDNYGGAFRAVEYLIQTGSKRILMFSSPYQTQPVRERERGYREALQHYGLKEAPIIRCGDREAIVSRASQVVATGQEAADAIFCVNDKTADAVVYVAKMKRVNVPQQLSICGFSNDPITAHTDPMQTTVEQYGERMGALAAERLITYLEGGGRQTTEDYQPETVMVATDLIVRETTH